ncbi:cytochrome c [Sulfuricurvum sp.]|uniref:c-type cytochrome n=1 Tax=Sulfuricurvum sp. TaxID=2025608 RepID=UPI003561DB9B
MKKMILATSLILGFCAAAMAEDGAALFKKCAACHGPTGEKPALGKSKVIKDMTKADIEKALIGYQDGTYGASSKAVMKGQAASLTPAQITAIATLIGK